MNTIIMLKVINFVISAIMLVSVSLFSISAIVVSYVYCHTFSCSGGWMNVVKVLVEERNVQVNATDKDRQTPLHKACR